MARSREPANMVRCFVCEKKINIGQKRKYKKDNGSGRAVVSKARELRDGRWVCSDTCFHLAVNPSSGDVKLEPE